MKKLLKRVEICMLAVCCFWCGAWIAELQNPSQPQLRLHIMMEHPEQLDAAAISRLRESIAESLRSDLMKITDTAAAAQYLRVNLNKLCITADRILEELGIHTDVSAAVYLEKGKEYLFNEFPISGEIYRNFLVTFGSCRE